jgi:Prealbumin-like fold domain
LSVTRTGQLSQRTSFLVLISIVAILLSAMAFLRPMSVLAQDNVNDHPALNIAKENEDGDRLAGAVFVVEGSDEQFTTGDNGKVCITSLNGQFLEDRPYEVTEITPPPGYALPAEPTQTVEPDNDGTGHCDSPDAVFVDPAASGTPSPSPSESQGGWSPSPSPSESQGGGTPTLSASPTPRESELGGTPTPSPSPRESELGGNPTPTPADEVPDTATTGLANQVPALVLSLVLVGSLATLFSVRVAGRRR